MAKLTGRVDSILADDIDGSRHQRFIVKLESGQTLLIAHNIDLAPRVPGIKVNGWVKIYGEYIWNEQGGIIHKTHFATNATDPDGWIRYKSVVYQ